MKTCERVLLDTHAYIWLVSDPDRLSTTAYEAVIDIDTEVYVSAASLWEISTKARLSKLPGGGTLAATFEDRARLHVLEGLPMGFNHSRLAGELDWDHRDPFDRMLAAQSMLENLPLVTNDSRLQAYDSIHTIW